MKKTVLALSLALMGMGAATAADPAKIDWTTVPTTKLTLFYPGQSSYEWLRSTKHKGARKTSAGQSCVLCHDAPDEEKELGASLVKGGPLEANPVKGKNGFMDLKVQAAYDAKNAYIRYQWKTNNSKLPGSEYEYYRFDGKAWKTYGGPRLDKPVQEGKQPAIYEERATIMIDDGKVKGFAQQGCWLTCHDGERDMPHEFTKEEIAANPLMTAIKKNDVRKYLPDTRTDPSDWKTGKSVEEIAKLKADGKFVDLIQWRAYRSNPVGMADDGYVLEWRNFDAGKNMFASNLDGQTKQPKFMYDAAKFGAKALTDENRSKKESFLIKGDNAVAFDPNAGWKEGDLLPRYILSAADSSGSAADNKAQGAWKDGEWTVVLVRPLNQTNPDDKALKDGGVYNVGFAIHDDNITTRGHHVSFVKTLGFGVKADIQAVKLP